MNLIEALILGFVQGITEFLPISSTAHIVIVQILFDLHFPGLTMEIFLHLASVLAVILYFRKDVWMVVTGFFSYIRTKSKENKVQFYYGLYILTATLITGVLGMLLSDAIDESLKSPVVIACALILTGLFLIFIEKFYRYGAKDETTMGWKETILIALAQTLAVMPGISRSGATLIAALGAGLNREAAVRFSFLLAIPVILGSTVLMFKDVSLNMVQEIGVAPLVVAFIATFLFSVIGIMWLIDFLKKSKLVYFAIYCFLLAIFVLFFL